MSGNDQEEKHKYKRIETLKSPGTLFHAQRVRIVLLCSDCGDVKVVDI